jgi:hypothetical protein
VNIRRCLVAVLAASTLAVTTACDPVVDPCKVNPTHSTPDEPCIEADGEPCDSDPCDSDDLFEGADHKTPKPKATPAKPKATRR